MTKPGSADTTIVGSDKFVYEADDAWAQLPDGWTFHEAVGVATDSQDRVYVFNRGEHPLMVFDRDGRFLQSWGEGRFVRPHGIWIGPDDLLYLSDDQDHTIGKYTPEGELLLTLGTSGRASDSGVENSDYRTIKYGGPPFNQPTNLAIAPSGDLFVSDGYGNCRVHRFSPDGELLLSWGEPGTGPGEFQLPHGIGVDSKGRVFVADRENSRLQLFNSAGAFLTEWTDVARPCDVFMDDQDNVFVAELGWHAGTSDPRPDQTGGRVSVFDREGQLLGRWGGGKNPQATGDFAAPHDIWVDSQGSVYVAEVTMSAAVSRGLVSPDCPSLQKFVKK